METIRGRIRLAREDFLTADHVEAVQTMPLPERRRFLRAAMLSAAAAGAGALSGGRAMAAEAEGAAAIPASNRALGTPVANRGYGLPSKYEENVQRRMSPGLTRTQHSSVSFTPLQNLFGIITPSGVHFERHHAGAPEIDPRAHRLMIHGLVDRPRMFTVDDIMRFPSVSRVHFIECGANSGMEWGNVAVPTVQYTHGMLACSEFTGVPLSRLLEEVGADTKRGRFILAEGACGAALTRTITMEMALDDVLVVYGQNGEMLRPENGYPLRLLVPGVQGVSNVKWLRRLEVGDQPWNTREEALHYVDLMPNGIHRQYTWIQEAKSVITTPSGGQVILDKGYHEITGLAWSGRGKVKRVDVTVDGGKTWRPARLQEPVHTKALVRFRYDWNWDGRPAILGSRVMDETGYVQPSMPQLREVRGTRSIYHNNAIQYWLVGADGEVSNVQVD